MEADRAEGVQEGSPNMTWAGRSFTFIHKEWLHDFSVQSTLLEGESWPATISEFLLSRNNKLGKSHQNSHQNGTNELRDLGGGKRHFWEERSGDASCRERGW